MEGFLKQVASHLFHQHGDNISQLTIVFPNRRGGVFFTNYLNSMVDKPLIAPEIITINELFSKLSPLHVIDRLSLIFRLYQVYRESTHSTEPFDDFYFWGEMLIHDFDQVDKYLVNARELFTNVTELKEIDERFSDLHDDERERLSDFWKTLSNKDKTPNQLEFIRLWEDLYGVYEQFKLSLLNEGLAYEGMLYRDVVTKGLMVSHSAFKDQHFVFVGFNALNKCEEELLESLQSQGKGSFFWDYDHYYLDDQNQEAGYFLRKNMARFPQTASLANQNSLSSIPKKMKVVNIASQVGQAQVAAKALIEQSSGAMNFDDTAVVLCDEELLLPVLNALPESIDKINVTMGFPLKMTPVFSLISQLIDLQKNARQSDRGVSFYNKDVLRILSHQLVVDLEPEQSKNLTNAILANNVIYLTAEAWSGNDFFLQIFTAPGDIISLSDYFIGIINRLFVHWQEGCETDDSQDEKIGSPQQRLDFFKDESTKGGEDNGAFYREYLYQAYLAVNKLKDILVHDGIKVFESGNFVSPDAFYRFLIQYLSTLSIPFEGEPLAGLQVMGILETRTLDFKNLILLSMNDGVMPKISSSGSFIPYNLRRVFGLPTIEEQNAMYAYYFYRLLQRAENVTFVYDSGSGALSTGEKSRYLYQLELESPFKITQTNITFGVESVMVKPIQIEKLPNVMQSLNHYLDGSKILSPSAIDKYLTCPLQFYFRYSAGLYEPDEISEEVDAKIFGLLFHDTMENIYRPYMMQTLTCELIDEIISNPTLIDSMLKSAFRKIYFKGTNKEEEISFVGRNWLIYEIVKKYVLQLLNVDKKRTPFEIVGLEKKVDTYISVYDGNQKVRIGGTIDRLDKKDGHYYIIDYKTGDVELSYTFLTSLFDKEDKKRNKAVFQTLVYSYILHKNQSEITAIYPGIYPLRAIFNENFDLSIRSKAIGNQPIEFLSLAGEFETLFKTLLEEIFDVNLTFAQTDKEDHCKYCPYKQICRR